MMELLPAAARQEGATAILVSHEAWVAAYALTGQFDVIPDSALVGNPARWVSA